MKKKMLLKDFMKRVEMCDISDYEMIVEILEEMSQFSLNQLYHTRWDYCIPKPIDYICEAVIEREGFTKEEQELVPKLTVAEFSLLLEKELVDYYSGTPDDSQLEDVLFSLSYMYRYFLKPEFE